MNDTRSYGSDGVERASIHLVSTRTRGLVTQAMAAMPLSLAGVRSRRLQESVLDDAVRGSAVFGLVAIRRTHAVGYSFVVTDWPAFTRGLVLRHPWVATQIAFGKASGFFRSSDRPERAAAHELDVVLQRDARLSWSENEPGVAKILFTTVEATERSKGVGRRLVAGQIAECRRRQCHEVRHRVSRHNLPSLRMLASTGCAFYADGDYVLGIHRLEAGVDAKAPALG